MKTIELTNQHLSYKARYKARRKTLAFKEKYFSYDEGIFFFLCRSYKMWATKIIGGYKELLNRKKK